MFCITLEGSRRARDVRAEFSRVGLEDSVVIVKRERDFADGKRGCFQSHQAVMRLALEQGYKSFVVFEDDVAFSRRSHSLPIGGVIDEALAFVAENPSVVLGLGGLAMGRVGRLLQEHCSMFRSAPFACTHAYVVSDVVARQIIHWDYLGRHIDHVFMEQFSHNMGLTVPSIAFQKGYFDTAEITTTDDSVSYKLLTATRNVVSAFVVQVLFELFFVLAGKILPPRRSNIL